MLSCQKCGNPILGSGKKFCSRSCSAKVNNLGVRRHGKAKLTKGVAEKTREGDTLKSVYTFFCENCNKPFIAKTGRKYCSSSCCTQKRKDDHRSMYLSGAIIPQPQTLRKYVLSSQGHNCSICGITEWQGKPTPLVMDHIDGNSENNDMANLRMVCPNCDALLPTFKARNRGNGRHSRRERYAQGKSY